ncbi:hypothetical protein HF1_11710 [Mycoplasma haemofelis str. Langford 1]|uniref:Uncharacterized protein n=1 Tax=Mycoplasma haemofelis (strain Langford 1) TaxID=941640 RepID=E8ZJ58_MYCHL|nr:hypothetical protein [Mycoplasma haemofelis]CBY93179.1 hypothetical protein HF1_11710 [Mycoplasma haemofelis str. Langford 1]
MKLGTVAASLGGASAASVAAAGGYHYLSSKNPSIQEVLKDSKLISGLSSDAVTKQWEEEFESAKTNIKTLIGFNSEDKAEGGKALAKWCNDQMSLDSVKNEDVLKNVKNYCLVRSVSSQLSRLGKTLLGSSHTTEWTTTYKKRKTQQTPRTDVGLDGNWNGDHETTELPTVKNWCSANSGKDFVAKEGLYEKVLKWCTQEGANEQ